VQRVVVSTDDPAIATVSKESGAGVVRRPAEISGDLDSSESALLHALEHLRATEGYEPDLLIFLQCTSPLTLPEDIVGTVQALLDENADSALAVTPFHYFLWRRNEGRDAVGINHDKTMRLMRQEREPQYREAGAVYVMRTQGFLKAKHRFFGKTAMYVMPPERCLEIDEPVDLKIAETLLKERQRRQRAGLLPSPVAGLALDFDGVFTDNSVIVCQDGQEAVVCSRSDGWGLAQLKRRGLPILVLSTEQNPVVQARCDKLGISCQHGLEDKLPVLSKWMDEQGLERSQVVYVGNDVNDLSCLGAVGCGVAVADAHPGVLSAADMVLTARGGQGALRELADLILGRAKEEGNHAEVD
jgi:N-acylneuraminate cytidylyltransferase